MSDVYHAWSWFSFCQAIQSLNTGQGWAGTGLARLCLAGLEVKEAAAFLPHGGVH